MAYLDDWHSTPPDEQLHLKQICGFTTCGHMRYLHGTTSEARFMGFRSIFHIPGKCEVCRCQVFQDHPITQDEIIDAHEKLKAEIRLKDIGIGPVMCEQTVTEWNGLTATARVCLLEFGHEGQHVV